MLPVQKTCLVSEAPDGVSRKRPFPIQTGLFPPGRGSSRRRSLQPADTKRPQPNASGTILTWEEPERDRASIAAKV